VADGGDRAAKRGADRVLDTSLAVAEEIAGMDQVEHEAPEASHEQPGDAADERAFERVRPSPPGEPGEDGKC
jgi:hypothetical protein